MPKERRKEVLMDFPTYIQTKIPFGTSYKGYEEKGPGIESFYEWFLNGFPEGEETFPYGYGHSYTECVEIVRGLQRDAPFPRGQKIVGEYLMVVFPTNNPLMRDKRNLVCFIKWVIPSPEINHIWEALKESPQKVFEMVDSELLSLCPPIIKSVRFLRETPNRRFEQEGV